MNIEIKLDDGKFTYILNDKEHKALRHGEEWRDLTGDNLILNMGFEIESLCTQLAKANERVAELESLVQKCDEYLDINRYTAIGNMSILHRKMKELRKN